MPLFHQPADIEPDRAPTNHEEAQEAHASLFADVTHQENVAAVTDSFKLKQ